MSKLITPKARLSFPNLFVPTKGMDGKGEPKYDCVLLIPKTADISALQAAAAMAIKDKWPGKAPANLKDPIRDGDAKDGLDGYAGHWFIRVSSKQKPGLVDANLQPIIEAGDIYPGCYVRASVAAYAYDKNGNRGVAFGFRNLQKLADGESFGGGGSKAEDDFSSAAAAVTGSDPF
jgi:hypothetical protein